MLCADPPPSSGTLPAVMRSNVSITSSSRPGACSITANAGSLRAAGTDVVREGR